MKKAMPRLILLIVFMLAMFTAAATKAVASGKATCRKGESTATCQKRVNAEIKAAKAQKSAPAKKTSVDRKGNEDGVTPPPPKTTKLDQATVRVISLKGTAYEISTQVGPTREHYQSVWTQEIDFLMDGGDPTKVCDLNKQLIEENRSTYWDTKNWVLIQAIQQICGVPAQSRAPLGPYAYQNGVGLVPPAPGDKTAVNPPTGGNTNIPANCAAMETIANQMDNQKEMSKEFCDSAYSLKNLGRGCFAQDAAWDTVTGITTTCKQGDEKGFTKIKNSIARSIRTHTTDDMQCGWGHDFPNRDCKGGDWFLSLTGTAATVGFWKTIVYEQWVPAKWKDKLGDRNPKTYSSIINNGPTSPAENTPGQIGAQNGPGEPGGTSNANTLPNTDINALANQFPSAGGVGVYGSNHPIAIGDSYSGNNTMPSDLTPGGYSSGMTKISAKILLDNTGKSKQPLSKTILGK